VRDRVVLRLERELSDEAVHELARVLDLIKKGTVEKSRPLPEETNEPEFWTSPARIRVEPPESLAALRDDSQDQRTGR